MVLLISPSLPPSLPPSSLPPSLPPPSLPPSLSLSLPLPLPLPLLPPPPPPPSPSLSLPTGPDAVIIPVYTPVNGENPDKLGPNEFTAGGILILNCSLDTLSNGLTYTWSMAPHHDCTNCHTDLSSKTSQTLTVLLYPQYTGNYTCSINGSLTSQPFTVHLRGKPLVFFSFTLFANQ